MTHTAQAEIAADLLRLLEDFSERINAQPRLRTTLATWRPEFFIQARDTLATFQIHFEDSLVQRVVPTDTEPGDNALLLRGDEDTLRGIFSGTLRPLAAYTDGMLEVYGSQKDQIKLDAIVLVVWGL